MTERTTTEGRNGPEHPGSSMPPATTARLEQDEQARGNSEVRRDGETSAAELEREIERERAEVTGTLNEIRRSFSPGQLLDQALDYAKHSGGREFADNLGRSVRDNPLPLLLIGAGVAWMMSSSGQGGSSRTGEKVSEKASEMRDRAASAGSSAADAASQATARFSGAASSARDTLSRASHLASDAAGRTGQATGDRLREAAERTGSLAHDARDSMSQAGVRAREGWSRLAEEQPLLLGAIGVAVGAAIAAALPSTRTEDRVMGEASDAVKDEVQETASRQFQHAKQVATETYQDVAEDLDKRGLSKEAAADAAVSTAEKIHDAADKVAHSAKTEVEKKADKPNEALRSARQREDSSSSSASYGKAAADKPERSHPQTSGQPSSSPGKSTSNTQER